MTMGMEGGFLKMTDEDELIDKFIDTEGKISEDELSKLSGEEKEDDARPDDDSTTDVDAEADAGGDPTKNDPDVESDRQSESVGDEPVDVPKQDKRTRAESNQAKALRIEREKRKELERTLTALREQSERAKSAEDRPKEIAPDPEEDPVGYQNHKIERLEKMQQQHQDYLRQQYEHQQQHQQQQVFLSRYAEDAKEYSQEQPDFMDAYNHLINSRLEEHLIAGYDKSVAQEIVKQEEAAIVAKAFEDGVSPSERVYLLAQKRGYSQSVRKPEQGKPKSSKLAAVKQGLSVSKSLGPNAGGSQDDNKLNIEDIDSLSDKEVDVLYQQMRAGKLTQG